MERKNSVEQFAEFWAKPTGYDVWFLGNSHMYRSVLPMELWKENGIRSYVLAASGSYPAQTYWTLVNALDYAKPKVLVVDSYLIHQTNMTGVHQLHNGLDAIPLSVNKIRAVMDLFDTTEDRMEYLFKFSVYHNRWEEIEKADFTLHYDFKKGCKISTAVKEQNGYRFTEESDMIEEETIGYFYMRKIIELCQEYDIAVVLTAIPCCKDAEVQRGMNGVARLSEEYDVPFLNMSYDDTLQIDCQTDFKDTGHLNLSGQRKTSEYFGKYLVRKFNFSKSNLEESEIEKWEKDYLGYAENKDAWLKEQNDLKGYLLWLQDAKFTCEIYQKETVEDTSTLGKLLGRVSEKRFIGEKEAVAEIGEKFKGDYAFIVKNAETGEIIDKAIFKNEKRT